jgi:hypothetical protein
LFADSLLFSLAEASVGTEMRPARIAASASSSFAVTHRRWPLPLNDA